ncbi:MAG: PEP-CTERM sorting domain-containing protein [Verrucomicrobiaceae bacterium]
MKQTKQLVPTLVGSVCVLAQAHAATIYSENFDGLTVGNNLTTSTDWSAAADDYVVQASNAAFSSNNLLVGTDATNFNFANWDDGTQRTLLTISFDIVDLGTSGAGGGDRGIRFAASRTTSNAALVDVNVDDLADNTLFHYDIVANITGSSVLYEDGITSIAATSYDVWVNGVKTVDGAALVGAGSGNIDGVGMWARRPETQLYVDNLAFRDTAFFAAAIPEPSSLGLLSFGALALLRRRSR